MVLAMEDRVESVLAYASRGWKCYPVQPPANDSCTCRKGRACEDPGKHPNFELGGLTSATVDPSILKTLFGSSEASIGLICDSFWVLDIDGEAGLRDLDRLIAENGELPRTPTAATGGGGKHYLFRVDRRVSKNQTKIQGLSIDLKTKGGAIVAAPSLHASGNRYRWIVSPEEADLAAAPEWLINFVTGATAKSKPAAPSEFSFEDLDLRTAPGVGDGERTDKLCRLVGSHLGRLGDTPDLLQLATDWGRRCDPPMKEASVAKTVANLVAKHLANNPQNEDGEATDQEGSSELQVLSFREIEAKPVAWLWPGRFALGKITLLTGEGGVGKSMLTCDMAARISKGTAFPDGASCQIGDSFFIGSEDGAEDTVRPRLDAAGANVDRVHLIRGPKPEGEEYASPIDLSRHIGKLDTLLGNYPEAKLVVIDPIMDYLGAATNSDRATDVRRVLSPLRSLAERHQVAIVAMNHLNKAGKGSKNRSLGSGAFVQVARIELRVCEDPEDADRRLLLPVKNNLAAAPGLAYRIQSGSNGSGFAVWEEGTVEISINEVENEGGSEDRSAIEEAVEWIRGFLSDGAVKAAEAKKQAFKDGIADRTLNRAKKKLGVKTEQRERVWWWQLSEQSNSSEAPSSDVRKESGSTFTF